MLVLLAPPMLHSVSQAYAEEKMSMPGTPITEKTKHLQTEAIAPSFGFPCVHRRFEEQAVRMPRATAVVFGMRRLTYQELNERANQLARHLQGLGIGRGSLVGIGLPRSPLMLVALFAVWKAGGAYVPLDPAYPPQRLAFMIHDANLRLVLTCGVSHQTFDALTKGTAAASLCLDDRWAAIAAESSENVVDSPNPDDLAYVMYTSGSTGKPKGAMVTQGGLANYVTWAARAYGLQPGGSIPVHSSLSFDLTVTSLFPPLLAGAEVELLPESDGVQHLVDALKARKRSLVKITPAHLDLLNQELRLEMLANVTDAFVIGGENLTAEKLEVWRQHAPHTRLINEYGPTETVVGCCVYEVEPSDPHTGSVPIGRPIANTLLYVLGPDLRPVPPGSAGELYIGGAGVARGYLNRLELTQARFLQDPFSDPPGAHLYRTGDLVRYREGSDLLEYLGRMDDQVKVAGYRMELGEIETVLAAHPQIRACAVLAQSDDRGEKRLLAFVVPQQDSVFDFRQLAHDLRSQLPPYMIPSRFVRLDALPLTANGKVDRNALLAVATSQTTSWSPGESATESALTTATETMIASLFAEVLQLQTIGPEEDFFDLGGRSLAATRLMMQLRTATGLDLPLRLLYESSTIRGLAAAVDTQRWVAGTTPTSASPAREALSL